MVPPAFVYELYCWSCLVYLAGRCDRRERTGEEWFSWEGLSSS